VLDRTNSFSSTLCSLPLLTTYVNMVSRVFWMNLGLTAHYRRFRILQLAYPKTLAVRCAGITGLSPGFSPLSHVSMWQQGVSCPLVSCLSNGRKKWNTNDDAILMETKIIEGRCKLLLADLKFHWKWGNWLNQSPNMSLLRNWLSIQISYSRKGNVSCMYEVCKAFYQVEEQVRPLSLFYELNRTCEELDVLITFSHDVKDS